MPPRGLLLALVIACCWISCRADFPATAPPITAPAMAQEAHTGRMKSPRAQIDHPPYRLLADSITINQGAQEVVAKGNAEMHSPGGILYADFIRYNFKNRSVDLYEVRGAYNVYKFRAARMTMTEKKEIHLQQAMLTTCELDHPHYNLFAHSVIFYPNKKYDAQKVSLVLAGHKLFTIPRIEGDLGVRNSGLPSTPLTAGVTSIDGAFVGGSIIYPLANGFKFTAQGRVGTAKLIRGEVAVAKGFMLNKNYGRGLISLVVDNRADVANRITPTTSQQSSLSRLTMSREPVMIVSMDKLSFPGPLHGIGILLGGSMGSYLERPTLVSANRRDIWAMLQSPIVPFGPLRIYGEIGQQNAYYSSGTHRVQSAALTLESRPELNYYLNFSLIHQHESGITPFLFDRVVIPDEFYSEFEVPVTRNGRWRVGFWDRLDVHTGDFRDYNVMGIYHLDCISYGLNYNAAQKSFNIAFVINAFSDFHHGASSLSFAE